PIYERQITRRRLDFRVIRAIHTAVLRLFLRSCCSLLFKTLENFMEVVLERDAFLKGLQMVQNIVEPRQTLPILANVLLEAEGEIVRMTATDLEVETLRDMLGQTSFAVSHDETRYALSGVLFVFQGKDIRMVATDGHRLAMSVRSLGKGVGGATGIVPRKAVTEIMRVLGASEEVQVAITENQFVLQMPNFVMTARLIDGQFPNYEAVIPKSHPGKLVAVRGTLSAALRRVSVMAEERNKPVKLALSPASLKVTASSQELGEAEEIIE